MYPAWVFYVVGLASAGLSISALVSIATAIRRRWRLTAGLGRLAVLGVPSLLALAAVMIVGPPMAGIHLGVASVSKPARLGKTISELMNGTALGLPGLIIGMVTWPLAAYCSRRERLSNETARDKEPRVASDRQPI